MQSIGRARQRYLRSAALVWPRAAGLLLAAALAGGCAADRCEKEPPAFEVTVRLEQGIDGAQLRTLEAAISIDGQPPRARQLALAGMLADGATRFVVKLAAAARFTARVVLEARDAQQRTVATADATFSATPDACNFFELTLRRPAGPDGGGDAGPPDGGGDGPGDAGADAPVDAAADQPPDGGPDGATHLWSKGIGGSGESLASGAAIDGDGNVVVVGYFTGAASFGGALLTSGGGQDVFLASYEPSGAHLWSKRFGSAGNQRGLAVAVGSSGDVIVCGQFQETLNLGGDDLASAGGQDVFVAGFGSAGQHLWSKRFGGAATDAGHAVAVDASGNVTLTGSFQGTVDPGGGDLSSAGDHDVFVVSYSAGGAFRWARSFGDGFADVGRGIAVDASGNVTLTGEFHGKINCGSSDLTSGGGYDVFVASYDADGEPLWSKRFGADGSDSGRAVAADAAGNVTVTGYFNQAVSFGGSELVTAGGDDIFVASYDTDGKHRWSCRFGSTHADQGRGVAVDASGDVAITGYFQKTVDFGGGPLTASGWDVIVASFGGGCAHRWSRGFGSDEDDIGRAIAVAADAVVVVGQQGAPIDFGGGSVSGDLAAFVAALAP